MNWEKINIKTILELLRNSENKDLYLDGEYSVIYSDGKEQLKISYKRLD